MCKLLVITTLYPNQVQQNHGIFVETRLRHLLGKGDMDATVIAPVPWFPINNRLFPEYSKYSQIPRIETRNGIVVHHPRYLVIPRVGMVLTPFFLAFSIFLTVKLLRKTGLDYDVVDAHYYYPDGVAVAFVAGFLQRPFLVTARGTDINLIPRYRLPRRMILWAAKRATASITVCRALKDRMVELGAAPEKIHVLRNGVDLVLFRPLDRTACRRRYSVTRTTLLSVGHLIERKGHNFVIDSLKYLPEVELIIVGTGDEYSALRAQVERLQMSCRVRFLGSVSQRELAEIYNAVDILVLASSREGWANVLLESMACGTPVVATRIWGTPEVVDNPAAGVLIGERSGEAIAAGVQRLIDHYPSRKDTRSYAEKFSWDDTVVALHRLFRKVKRTDMMAESE